MLDGPASLSSGSFIHGKRVPGISGKSSSDEFIFKYSEIRDNQISNSSGSGEPAKVNSEGFELEL